MRAEKSHAGKIKALFPDKSFRLLIVSQRLVLLMRATHLVVREPPKASRTNVCRETAHRPGTNQGMVTIAKMRQSTKWAIRMLTTYGRYCKAYGRASQTERMWSVNRIAIGDDHFEIQSGSYRNVADQPSQARHKVHEYQSKFRCLNLNRIMSSSIVQTTRYDDIVTFLLSVLVLFCPWLFRFLQLLHQGCFSSIAV